MPRGHSGVKLACAGAICTAALVVAGCGSSSEVPRPSSANGGAATMAIQTRDETTKGNARGAALHHAHRAAQRQFDPAAAGKMQPKVKDHYAPPKVTKGNSVQRPFAGTGGATANDDNPAGKASRADSGGRPTTSGQPNPCALVTGAQAQGFTGKAVVMKEAPLGPTCIYHVSGENTSVTIAVERLHFSALKPHIEKLSQVSIGGRAGYCGVYGAGVTYVPLTGNRVLNVSAPCAVGTKFAAAALPKLG